MKKFQEYLDEYGASRGCVDWAGWIHECRLRSDLIENQFKELEKSFLNDCTKQIEVALSKFTDKISIGLYERLSGKKWQNLLKKH